MNTILVWLARRLPFFALYFAAAAVGQEPEFHQANGVKVGEVTQTTANIWTRYTRHPTWNTVGPERKGRSTDAVPSDEEVPALLHAAPGAPGELRVRYAASPDLKAAATTAWAAASPDDDFTRVFRLADLQPDTEYFFAVDTRDPAQPDALHRSLTGRFRTAPPVAADAPVRFLVMTCQAYKDVDHPDGFEIYHSMLADIDGRRPDFIVPNGDIVYLDSEEPRARNVALARYHWNRMYGFPRLIEFHRQVPGYWTKDDHDTYDDDSWPREKSGKMSPLTFAEGLKVNREQLPWGEKPYRTVRWGKHLQIWMTEGREFRTPNNAADGPEKTMWGAEQKAWFKETVSASDATWKVLVSPTPLVGPDRDTKHDNHANDTYRHEGNELRQFMRDVPGVESMFVVCGDRHWQYHSVDPATGLHEFSAGAASDPHAGGSPGLDREYHKFHRVKGGYLSVAVDGNSAPTIMFRHHDVEGGVVYEKRFATE